MNEKAYNLKSISVLIVDDDSSILDAMKVLLSRIIGTVYTASNGKDGLSMFKEHSPDMVVSDIRMPILTGLEMAKAIKDINPELPIAIISAHNDTKLLLDSIDIGVDKYLLKPLDTGRLIKWIKTVSMQIVSQREIKLQEENLHFIMDHNPAGVCMIDYEKISYLNLSFLKLMHLDSFDNFNPDKHCIVNFIVNEENKQRFSSLNDLKLFLLENKNKDIVLRILIPDGSEKNIHFYNLFFKIYPQIERIIMIFTDITNIEKERSLLKAQATTDALTNIANRLYFDLYLDNQIISAKREENPFSLIMFDIDDFKLVNDTYGHPIGDQVLIELVEVVKHNIRKNDFLARWGGEEFMILSRSNLKDSDILAHKILKKIETHKFETVGRITCSFGISSFKKGSTRDSILTDVDKALYKAKSDGKNCVKSC